MGPAEGDRLAALHRPVLDGDRAGGRDELAILFYGAGLVVMPIALIYTGIVYYIFRGRVRLEEETTFAAGDL